MGLREYRKKRDFKKTLEPSGDRHKNEPGRIFVVQEHHASHLHYDFRLELNGVLKSWAVPKGPSQVPHEKRLAVEVEDHPLSYASFEGTIPKGEYGAGTVKIWDHGEWIPTEPPNAQLKKGHLEFDLEGEKLHGRWMLIRTHARGNSKKSNWLLMKKNEAKAASAPKKSKLPAFVAPQLATLSTRPPEGKNWIHEIKYDGYRTACRIDGKTVKLLTRRGLDWTDKYKSLEKECHKIPAKSAYLDGEVVWVDEKGKTQFQGLQNVLSNQNNGNIFFYVFDLLHLDGEDLQELPLLERKSRLKTLLNKTKSKRILFSEHFETRGSEIFAASCKMQLEGIISKDSTKPYETGRGKSWLKSKCKHVQEFVIGGYTPQKNGTGLGSLMMGAYDSKHRFRFVGKIGTGYGVKESSMLLKKLKKLNVKNSPFEVNAPKERAAVYVKPELVANVEFAEWTGEKILRHAAYKGLREDKRAKEVDVDEPTAATVESSSAAVELSHPDKVLFPATKNTKQDLADYYSEIQKWILPHLTHRPLSLLRCPSGAGKQCFFQKHVEGTIPGIFSDQIGSKTKGEMQEIIYAKGLQGLLGLVQMNTLELHSWGCHIKNIDYPDLIVFDLDPDAAVEWKKVKQAALTLKKLLERLGLKSFLKVTGGKGLHLHVPIEPEYSWEKVKGFAKSVCDKMALDDPSMFLTTATKSKRKGKIFLDYLRNGYGATAIVPYSARANPKATVALPISWAELAKLKAPDGFNITNVPKMLRKRRDPWTGYHKLRQRIKLLDKL